MSLDGFFSRLKTKERRGLESQALERIGILGSYLLPRGTNAQHEPPPGLKAEFRKAEELLGEASDVESGLSDSTREALRDVIERMRQTYRLY
jgi:hypothetical protein